MAKFVELMNTNSDQERFRFIFVNILLKQLKKLIFSLQVNSSHYTMIYCVITYPFTYLLF